MSERSEVGASTHDGAASAATGSDEPTEGNADGARRRRAAGLLEAAFGGEPAGHRTPPGVPAGGAGSSAEPSTTKRPATKRPATTRPATKRPASKAPAAKGPTEESTARTAPAATRSVEERPPVADRATAAAPAASAARTTPVRDDRPRRRGPLRARQVHRVVRRVDPWSMLKLSLVFYFCVWLMVVISGVLVWGVAVGSGTVEGVEGFIARLLAFEEFSFNADQIFRLFAMGGLILVFLATAVSAILAVLFNLISDLIGGIRITVIEEETTRRVLREP